MCRHRKPGRVIDIERHPAIEHQPEVWADAIAHVSERRDTFMKTLDAFGRPVVQRHLTADEPQLLCDIGTRAGCIEL